jgi:hypothetical protein
MLIVYLLIASFSEPFPVVIINGEESEINM